MTKVKLPLSASIIDIEHNEAESEAFFNWQLRNAEWLLEWTEDMTKEALCYFAFQGWVLDETLEHTELLRREIDTGKQRELTVVSLAMDSLKLHIARKKQIIEGAQPKGVEAAKTIADKKQKDFEAIARQVLGRGSNMHKSPGEQLIEVQKELRAHGILYADGTVQKKLSAIKKSLSG